MSRLFCFLILIFVLIGCQPTVNELPTLVPEPTEAPTLAPTLTPTPTRTPQNTLTPTPVPVIGRFATDPATIGYLRVVHAAPQTAPIDVYVDSTNFASSVEFGLATGRTNIIADSYSVRVTERGTSPDEAVLVASDLTIEVGQSLILIVSGVPEALGITVVEENAEPLNENESRVNFVHAVPLAPIVKGQQEGVDLTPLFDFGEQSGGIVVSSGDTTLSFATSEQTLVDYPASLFPRTHYTIILIGDSEDLETLSVLMFENQVAGRATIRAINVSSEAGAVDLYLDGELFAGNLAYGTASERQIQTDGNHALSIYPAGADINSTEPLLSNFDFSATTAADLSLILMGSTANLRVFVFNDDLSPIRPDIGRITFINALESAPGAQIGLSSAVLEDLGLIGYGEASPYYPINLGENRIFWMLLDGTIPEDNLNFMIESGRSYLYFLTGDDDNPVVITEPLEVSNEVAALPTDLNATPDIPIRVRIVNALDGAFPIDFILNSETLASNLPYGQATDYFEVIPASLPLTIFQTGNPTPIAQSELRLATGGRYTLYVYGVTENVVTRAFSDEAIAIQDNWLTIRLVNLSLDETVGVGLLTYEATDPLTPASTPAPSIPLGLSYLIARTDPNSISPPAIAFEGVQDLIVSDNRTGVIGNRIRSYNLMLGNHYDVVVTYLFNTNEIRAFVLQYPQG
jgi:hypothetical protein